MHWIDLLRLPLASLGQQKLRTCLTTLGVVFGAFVLAASLSIDEGVQRDDRTRVEQGRRLAEDHGRLRGGGRSETKTRRRRK